MNKIVLWGIIAVAVLGGAWFFSSKNLVSTDNTAVKSAATTGSTTGANQASATTSKPATGSSGTYRTLNVLLSRGGNYKCTFIKTTSAGRTDGTVYVSGSRLRGDFMTAFSAGSKVESRILYLSGTVYAWTPPVQQGYKAKATASNFSTVLGSSGSGGFNYSQPLDFSCSAWGGDAALFEFPKGIVFSNI